MVDAVGEAKGHENTVSQVINHKLMPWILACLAYFGAQALETLQGNDTDMSSTIQQMQIDLEIVKERTEQFADNAPNRWTRQMHDQYATRVGQRFEDIERRIRNLEK